MAARRDTAAAAAATAAAACTVLVHHELACRARLERRAVPGATLLRVAAAVGARVGRDGGLAGELRALLLRWGHNARSLELSLTCCPERRELAGRSDPDVLAEHMLAAPPDAGGRLAGQLVQVLALGRLLPRVSPDWLRRRVSCDRWLVYALGRGGHLGDVPLGWLSRHVACDDARARSVCAGGLAAGAPLGWLCGYLRDRRALLWALHACGRLPSVATDAWIAATLPAFCDAFEALHLSGRLRETALPQLLALYDAHYRRRYSAPDDLAACLQQHTVGGGVYDVSLLLGALVGVSAESLYCVVACCGPELAGAEALRRHAKGVGGALADLGWTGLAALDAANLIMINSA